MPVPNNAMDQVFHLNNFTFSLNTHVHASTGIHVRCPDRLLLLAGPALLRIACELHDRTALTFLERAVLVLLEGLQRQVAHLKSSELVQKVVERHPANNFFSPFIVLVHNILSSILVKSMICKHKVCLINEPELSIFIWGDETSCKTLCIWHVLPLIWVVRPRPLSKQSVRLIENVLVLVWVQLVVLHKERRILLFVSTANQAIC